MTTLYKYQIFCTTSGKWEYKWHETDIDLTECPVNTTHTINPNSSLKVSELSEDSINIKEENYGNNIPTGGNYNCFGVSMEVNSTIDSITLKNFNFKYPMSGLNIKFIPLTENSGDIIEAYINPDTIIGTITENVNINQSIINVSESAFQYINIGYLCSITDGVNIEDLGHIITKDLNNNTVTVEKLSTTNYLASSPTYFRITLSTLFDIEIGGSGVYDFGNSKIGASYIPTGTIGQLKYINKTGGAKRFSLYMENLY